MRYWLSATCISALLVVWGNTAFSDTAQIGSMSALQHRDASTFEMADGVPESRYLEVIEALKASGYTIQSTSITFLNRAKIRASNALHLREIVISRASGEVLRDAIVEEYNTIPLTLDGRMQPVVPEMIIENSPKGIMIIAH